MVWGESAVLPDQTLVPSFGMAQNQGEAIAQYLFSGSLSKRNELVGCY